MWKPQTPKWFRSFLSDGSVFNSCIVTLDMKKLRVDARASKQLFVHCIDEDEEQKTTFSRPQNPRQTKLFLQTIKYFNHNRFNELSRASLHQLSIFSWSLLTGPV